MKANARIYVAGSATVLGSAIVRALQDKGFENLVGLGDQEPDPASPIEVDYFMAMERPEYIFIAAGKSGGIKANLERGAEFMEQNLSVATALIPAAHRHGVTKLLYLASACVYPRDCAQPMRETDLMTGPLEPSSGPYSIAKIAGMNLVRAYRDQHNAPFIAAIPTNYFGPGDSFDPEHSHVVPSLMRRMDDARLTHANRIEVWGTGQAQRELMPVADLAHACIHAMEHYDDSEPINLANGFSLSIADLAQALKEIVGFKGAIHFDTSRPDGAPRKALDNTKLRALGWEPKTAFEPALNELYQWYKKFVVTAQLRSGAA